MKIIILMLIFTMKTRRADSDETVTESTTNPANGSEYTAPPDFFETTPSITESFTTVAFSDSETLPEEDFTTLPPPTEADINDDDDLDENLSDDAFNSLTNSTNGTQPLSHKNMTDAILKDHQQYLSSEWWYSLKHFASKDAYLRVCYYMASTYKNAMLDLRKYFHIRYLYYDNVEYEVGYVTHEIVLKYQIVLELYHLMQRKFEQHQDRHIAPTTYMLYMYTNILFQSRDIIHLCNMLHEIEKKYENYESKGVFAERVTEKISKHNKTETERERAIAAYNNRLASIQKRIRKEQRKKLKMMKKGKIFSLTPRTTRTYKKFWDLHYGWSIENW